MILGAAAVAVAVVLAVLPAIEAGEAGPIALGAGITAVLLIAVTLATGAAPPIIIATLLFVIDFGGVVALADPTPGVVPAAAAGLYLLVELTMRSLELRGRHTGWRDFRWTDALRIALLALLVGLMTWLVTILSTRPDLPGGIFGHGVGIAAVAAVIGVIWLLVGRATDSS